MSVSMMRSRSSRARLISDGSSPDRRNSFAAQRYPVRLCKSAKFRHTYPSGGISSVKTLQGKGEAILIPTISIESSSDLNENQQGEGSQSQTDKQASSIQRGTALTLGQMIERLSLNDRDRNRSKVNELSCIYSHDQTEKDYFYLKRRYQQGADLNVDNRRQKSRGTCSCWHRSDSVWRTFEDSLNVKVDPGIESRVYGVGVDYYRRYIEQFEKDRKAKRRQHLFTPGKVNAG